jgi:hypothetical protein
MAFGFIYTISPALVKAAASTRFSPSLPQRCSSLEGVGRNVLLWRSSLKLRAGWPPPGGPKGSTGRLSLRRRCAISSVSALHWHNDGCWPADVPFRKSEVESLVAQHLIWSGYEVSRQTRVASGIIDLVAVKETWRWCTGLWGRPEGGPTSSDAFGSLIYVAELWQALDGNSGGRADSPLAASTSLSTGTKGGSHGQSNRLTSR